LLPLILRRSLAAHSQLLPSMMAMLPDVLGPKHSGGYGLFQVMAVTTWHPDVKVIIGVWQHRACLYSI